MFSQLVERICSGTEITYEEALALGKLDMDARHNLFQAALTVTRHFHGTKVDLCSILNTKSGKCSEDCAFCSQSGRYNTGAITYPLLSRAKVLEHAQEIEAAGARRFSLVTSGRGIMGDDFEKILEIYHALRQKTGLKLCASLGIIDDEKARRLKDSGVSMYHHNLETSASYYPNICTTHTFQERVETIRSVERAGLEICSGGIIGLGESWEHRVEMAFQFKSLQVVSVPINILTPIEGTPLWGSKVPAPLEVLSTVAMFRLVLPGIVLRLAGGREYGLRDLQPLALLTGINGLMVGNYLTTSGRRVEDDLMMIKDLELSVT